jgi:hypothetical protein
MYVSLRWLHAMERKAGASSPTSTPAISNDRKTWGYRGLTVWTSPKLPSIDFLDDFLPACTNARPYHGLR